MFWLLFLACQSSGVRILGDAPPLGTGKAYVQACGEQHPTALALQKATGVQDCQASWKKLSRITQLDLTHGEISDLHPISSMENLQSLTAYGKSIEDLRPLSNLERLRELSLMVNSIEDIRPLSKLRQLRVLRLDGNRVSDISVLSKLYKLEKLSLDANQIQDFTPLAGLEAIQALNTNGNPVDPEKCPIEGDMPKQLRKYCKRMRKHQTSLQDALDPKDGSPVHH